NWTKEEDNILLEKVNEYGIGNWTKISKYLPTKFVSQISYRYKSLFPFKKGNWSKDDDQYLLYLVENFGKNWLIFSQIFNRSYYSILYRYNYL
ncbi:Homeodomain-like protein, partial [Glomus cerebriforme]